MNSYPSLHKAAALSFAAHLLFMTMASFVYKNPFLNNHNVYTVSLVAPTQPEAKAKPAAKAKAESMPEVKAAPPPAKPAPKPKPAPAPKKEDLKQYLAERLNDIKASKEAEQKKSEKIESIERMRRLRSISQTAAGKAAEGEGDKAEEILGLYTEKVKASIYEVWVFPNIDIKNLEAVISIKILKNGSLIVNRFESPSGNRLFDSSALKAISKASPVEPPPFGATLEEVILKFYPYEEKK